MLTAAGHAHAVTREAKSTRCLNSSLVGSLDRERTSSCVFVWNRSTREMKLQDMVVRIGKKMFFVLAILAATPALRSAPLTIVHEGRGRAWVLHHIMSWLQDCHPGGEVYAELDDLDFGGSR